MIHLVVALGCEAAALIDAFDLEPAPRSSGSFRLYAGAGARLIVSGVGSERAAAASAHLSECFARQPAVWVNVGVGAHHTLALGEAVAAHKVEERGSGRVFYPTLVVEPPFPTATVRTVDRAVARPAGEAVYEMEAAGFLTAVLARTTSETVGVVKVVSDHGVERPDHLDPSEITERLARHAPAVLEYGLALESLLSRRGARWRGDYLDEWLGRLHFSVTQRHQLARLANRAAALGVSRETLGTIEARSAGELVERLAGHLDEVVTERR